MSKTNKPPCSEAMQLLINDVRNNIPFDIPVSTLCSGICHGCSKKLIDYLDNELIQWEHCINQGDEIKFGDIIKLTKTSRKVYKVLQKNGHVPTYSNTIK